MPAVLAAILLAVLLLADPAGAQSPAIDRAVSALRSDPVSVDPAAERAISPADADRLRARIRRGDTGPVLIAILPASAGHADDMPRVLYRALRGPGTYATIVGNRFRAASTDVRDAGRLASEALQANRSRGAAAVLEDFLDRLAQARSGGGGAAGGGGTGGNGGVGTGVLALLGVLAAGGGLLMFVSGRRRRRERDAQVAELREAARDDLVALGDDVRSVDIDVDMPDADPRAREELGKGLDAYERAEKLLLGARDPADFAEITRTIDDGRQAMAATRARLEGREPPERRPPCFFDPRHGPSVEDVPWTPPDGGAERDVPVCAADATRLRDGVEPQAREVMVGGRSTPYWNAPGYFAPWAGGFFGGGSLLLPGLLAGTLLGGAMGWPDSAFGDEGGGDGGGGGDFGGGGGDLGGGDFGGGDLGGGDFGGGDFGGGDF